MLSYVRKYDCIPSTISRDMVAFYDHVSIHIATSLSKIENPRRVYDYPHYVLKINTPTPRTSHTTPRQE